MNPPDLQAQISAYMPYEEFLRIQSRLAELRKEEEQKLAALAQLQHAFLSAGSEKEIETVRNAVAQIRELTRIARQEKRELITELQKHMDLDLARNLYDQVLREDRQSPK